MRHNPSLRLASALTALVILAGAAGQPARAALAAPRAEGDAPLDAPQPLVADSATSYSIAGAKLFWNSEPPGCPPAAIIAGESDDPAVSTEATFGVAPEPAGADATADPAASPPPAAAELPSAPLAPAAPDLLHTETISRVSIYGSEPRTLWLYQTQNCAISQSIASNIVADANHIYWTTGAALVRLSTNANPGDAPEVVTAQISGTTELAIDNTYVLAIKVTGSNPNTTSRIWTVGKTNGEVTLRATRSGIARDPQSSYGNRLVGAGNYLFWNEGGALRRFDFGTNGISTIATGVGAYYAEGASTTCFGTFCVLNQIVFISRGAQIDRYNNANGQTTAIYAPIGETVGDIVADSSHIFFRQRYEVPCNPQPCFSTFTDRVVRRGRDAGGATDVLYSMPSPTVYLGIRDLKVADAYVFWDEEGRINRLPKNAVALPQTNMRITGYSITQGIQKPDNSVILIKDRRTFVRVFVKSDGPGDVSGVTARLYRMSAGGQVLGSILPVNSVGTNLTVRANPQRKNLNNSFLFELPWSWVSSGPLRLRAGLNPFRAPIETSYADNEAGTWTHDLSNSAALKVQFVSWGYQANSKTYWPHFIKDVVQTFSWVMRAYPLASKLIFDGGGGSQPGFHPNVWLVFDDGLGSRVMYTHDECQDLLKKKNGKEIDNRNLCASRYTNIEMDKMRSDNGLPGSRFFYGFIKEGPKFPRGQACCASNVSSGPTADPAVVNRWTWDTDGSYGDWYAAHEIAHTLGRKHPTPNGDDASTDAREGCGHSRSDNSYPYSLARIGADATYEGFDAGDPGLGIPRALYPGDAWYDVMSYCDQQWVSDYTYKGMYDYLAANSAFVADGDAAAAAEPAAAAIPGDWLLVYATIDADTGAAAFQQVARRAAVTSVPPLAPGGYSIRLFDASNAQLADYPLTPEADDEDGDLLGVNQIVTFAPGTRSVRLVRLSDGAVLATRVVSANAPAVSNVGVGSASSPIMGTVALSWTASDADGDALTFDVFYSKDGGGTLLPVKSNVAGTSTLIDTASLGGGSAIFRVIASDGVNIGQADSAPVTLADKPPMPMILTPGDGHSINYGQLVNFSGAAMDWQDGGVTGANLAWSNQFGPLGTGELLTVDDLPVGVNVITLKATNSKGLSATATITVIVGDNLDLLGPTLAAGPESFHWQFAVDAVAPVDQSLDLSNAGSGELGWSASTDAPWLLLSLTGGLAPASLTLTANPSGVANGSSVTGTVTVIGTAGGSVVTTLNIPVSVSKGVDPTQPGDAGPPLGSFLPIVTK